jgi:Predicted glycosyltransferases
MALFASVIIPSYCRPEQLTRCLQSLAQIDYARDDFEVIVVDDGSSTPLDAVVQPFQSQLNLRLIRQRNQGPAVARNTGVKAARGKIVAFIDDDCYADPAWLGAIAEALGDDRTLLVGGRVVNSLVKNQFSEASQALTEYLYAYYLHHNVERRFFTSNNMACFADTFRELGGFCTEYFSYVSEDRDLSNRWTQAGYELRYATEALVFHAHDLSLISFLKQHFVYGQGAFNFHKVRASGGTPKLEPISFYTDLILSSFSRSSGNRIAVAALLLLAQIANAGGFFWALGRNQLRPRNWQRKLPSPFRQDADKKPLSTVNR